MPVAQKYKKQPNAMDLLTMAGQETNKVKPGSVVMPQKQEKKPVVQQPVNLSSMPMFDRGIVPSYGQRNIKNLYGGTAPMGSFEQGIEMKKMGTKKVQENIATNNKDVRNYTIEGVINKMDTGEPVTIQELRTMARGANEDDLWDAIDTAMAEGAKFEGLNREKPVEVSGVDKFLRNIPGVTTAQQTMRGAQSGVLKGGLGILQGITDAGGWLSAQAEKINPFNPNAKSFSELFSTPESRQANYEKQKQFSDTASTYITENVRDPLVDKFNSYIPTADRESLPYTIGEEVGKIGTTMAATLPIGGAGAFSKIPLVARMALGAGEGVVGNALYNKASGAEYGDNAGLAGGIGALVPAGGALLKGAGRILGIGRGKAISSAIQTADNLLASGGSKMEKGSQVLNDRTLAKMWDTIQPDLTAKELAELRSAGLTAKSGVLGKTVALPDNSAIGRIKTALNIGLREGGDIQSNINKASDYIASIGEQKRNFLAQNNGIFNSKEINAIINNVEKPLDIVGDSAKIYKSIIDNVKKIISESDGTLLGLDDARVAIDDLIKKRYPNLYNNPATSSMKETVQSIRNAINSYIDSRIPGGQYKQYLSEMSNAFNIIDDLAKKGSNDKLGSNAIVRWIKNNPRKADLIKTVGGGSLLLGGLGKLFGGN